MQDFITCSQTKDKEGKREAGSYCKRVAGQSESSRSKCYTKNNKQQTAQQSSPFLYLMQNSSAKNRSTQLHLDKRLDKQTSYGTVYSDQAKPK